MFYSPDLNPAANRGAVTRISDFTTNAVYRSSCPLTWLQVVWGLEHLSVYAKYTTWAWLV